MTKSRPIAIELLVQVVLALAVGLCVSLMLAGTALLLAGGSDTTATSPGSPISATAARP